MTKRFALVALALSCVAFSSTKPQPCPVVTVTVTPSPVPAPTVTVTVTPEPSPMPAPSASPSALPSPVASPSPAPSVMPSPGAVNLFGLQGETVSFEVRPAAVAEELPVIDGLKIEAFEIMTVATTRPSYAGATPGNYEDPLFPVARVREGVNYWIDVTPTKAGLFSGSIGGKAFTVRGLEFSLTRRPIHPIYSELQFARIGAAHKIPDQGETLVERCKLALDYIALLRAHRVEPIKQWWNGVYPPVTGGKIDLDGFVLDKACSFRSQFLTGAIADPIIWGPDPVNAPSAGLLAAAKASIAAGDLPAKTRAYVWDEGELDPTLSTKALARATAAKPNLGVFITRRPSDAFKPFVSTFCPVQDWATPGMADCFYTSCMAHGCGNTIWSGTPLTVVEAPHVHPLAFPLVSFALGAKESLYFAMTVSLPSAWDPGGQFNGSDGKGNGDGNLLYPGQKGQKGLTANVPVGSIRLKKWREGSNMVEYWAAAKAAGRALFFPVFSQTDWSKDPAAYAAARESIARALFGLP